MSYKLRDELCGILRGDQDKSGRSSYKYYKISFKSTFYGVLMVLTITDERCWAQNDTECVFQKNCEAAAEGRSYGNLFGEVTSDNHIRRNLIKMEDFNAGHP